MTKSKPGGTATSCQACSFRHAAVRHHADRHPIRAASWGVRARVGRERGMRPACGATVWPAATRTFRMPSRATTCSYGLEPRHGVRRRAFGTGLPALFRGGLPRPSRGCACISRVPAYASAGTRDIRILEFHAASPSQCRAGLSLHPAFMDYRRPRRWPAGEVTAASGGRAAERPRVVAGPSRHCSSRYR